MTVFTKTITPPPFDEREILRYAGCKEASCDIAELMLSCIEEAKKALVYKVCYCTAEVKITGKKCDFGVFSVLSEALAKALGERGKVLIFGATVGVEFDRLIAKYTRLSPARAVMMQAVGAERIEALCDAFCAEMQCKKRFSPGYADLKLDVQRDIFGLLDCPKRIGLTLNESMLMSPSKSVTAFAMGDFTEV